MSGPIPLDTISKSLLKGTKNAFQRYDYGAACWLGHAPESFIQSMIFIELTQKLGIGVTLEDSPSKLSGYGCKVPPERKTKTTNASRFDIIGWYSKEEPRFIAEVKIVRSSLDGAVEDANRITRWIGKGNGHMQAGFLVLYNELKSEEEIRERFQKIATHKQGQYEGTIKNLHITKPEDGGYRGGMCVIRIKKKRRTKR